MTTHLGAIQLKNKKVDAWASPLFEAFVHGAWLLHWTDDTLYWVAKPSVYTEIVNGFKRLHNATGPALDSDVEPLYFWHGVMVPDLVVVNPTAISTQMIENESNVEVRRIMIERYGYERYLLDSGARLIHSDEIGALYRKEFPDDEPLVMVHVVNSTPEPDGSSKRYMIRVPPGMERARQAVAWSFSMPEEDYKPEVET